MGAFVWVCTCQKSILSLSSLGRMSIYDGSNMHMQIMAPGFFLLRNLYSNQVCDVSWGAMTPQMGFSSVAKMIPFIGIGPEILAVPLSPPTPTLLPAPPPVRY